MKKNKGNEYLFKMVLVGVLIASGVFFGIEIATTGIQRVQGTYELGSTVLPADTETPPPPNANDEALPPAGKEKQASAAASSAAAYSLQPGPLQVQAQHQLTFINRLTIKLGEALQALAKGGIRLVGGIFEEIIY